MSFVFPLIILYYKEKIWEKNKYYLFLSPIDRYNYYDKKTSFRYLLIG